MKRHAYSDISGESIKNMRESLGMTQSEIANELGISMRMWCYYEYGDKKVPKAVEKAIRSLNENHLPNETLSDFDIKRITALQKEIDRVLGIGSVDGERLQRILRQSSQEFDKVLSKH
tara:strand:+ start:27653 stop:28006 length:354 start_codon:yes stop_codon:yes gene_type:complete